MDNRLYGLKEQFKGIVSDLEQKVTKDNKDASPEAALLTLIASLLFVLIDVTEANKP